MNVQVKEMFKNIDKQKWMTYGIMFGILAIVCVVTFMPDAAWASKGSAGKFDKFEEVFGSIEKFITGPVGKIISVAGMICCGIVYIFARQDLSEGFKMLLQVCFGIAFIAFAASIVNSVFNGGWTTLGALI